MRGAISTVVVDSDRQTGYEYFPTDSIALLGGRAEVKELLSMHSYVDLIIPRGSNELVQAIQSSTTIPVLGHADGICSVYVDKLAAEQTAVAVVFDAKTQYPAVCNAAETLLIHKAAAAQLLPSIADALFAAGVTLRADEAAVEILDKTPLVRKYPTQIQPATTEDWDTEFSDLILAVKIVESREQAVRHINRHGSKHTDAIITEDPIAAEWFLSNVDTANAVHNASTRFADGFRYGFGAEVGVSTNKTHARGPVGLDGLCIYKCVALVSFALDIGITT